MQRKAAPDIVESENFRPIVRCARSLVIQFRSGRPIHVHIGALEKLLKEIAAFVGRSGEGDGK